MKSVAVMTDTVSGISAKLAEELDIKVVPLHVIMDGIDYLDTKVGKTEVYARLARKENLPTTSSPNVGEYLEAFRELSQRAEAVLCISFTSGIGMGYKAAIRARDIAREEMPGTKFEVIDTRTAHGAQLLCVLEAARAVAQGKSLSEVMSIANRLVPELYFIQVLNTAYYLRKGGRAGESVDWTDTPLATEPIMEMDASTGGVMTLVARARNRAKAIGKMVEMVKERNGNRGLHAVISHDDTPGDAERLKQQLLSQLPVREVQFSGVSAITIIHDGPGALRLGWYSE